MRSGCEVRYLALLKLNLFLKQKDDKQRAGLWLHDKDDHSGHPFVTSPMRSPFEAQAQRILAALGTR